MEIGWKVVVLTVGGACGVNARYWLGLVVARWLGGRYPWGTFVINVSGSFAIGLGAVLLAERWANPLVRIFVVPGFLGGYTTFSAYMLESYTLWERGDRAWAFGNLFGSVGAGLIAVALGASLGQWLLGSTGSITSPSAQVGREVRATDDELLNQESPEEPAG